jgi:oxygen-independent coproporphyrinogen-3 oxidase
VTNNTVGVYISVPFCKAKCTFCNFASGVFSTDRMQGYVDRVSGEILGARVAAKRLAATLDRSVDSIYFGGGTEPVVAGTVQADIWSFAE